MPLRGRARHKDGQEIGDFDFYDWWKALIKAGVQPSEAWQMDFLETAHVLELQPTRTDFTLALYHERKQNGAPELEH